MAWQIYELTDSPLQVGLIGLARALPLMSFALFGGMLADVVDRRRLMIAVQFAQFSVSALLVVVTVSSAVTPLHLYLASAALALCTALDNPTRNSIVPNLVPSHDLFSAMALTNLQNKLGRVLGPSFAGITLALSGPALCYAADAVSWLVMLTALLLMRSNLQSETRRPSMSLRSIGEGLGFVWTHPIILFIVLLDFGSNLFATNRALLPVYARDILMVGAPGLGLMFAASAAGAVVATAVMSVLPPIRRMGLWVLVGAATYAVCTAVFAVSQHFWLTLAMLAGVGAGNALSVVLRGTISQLVAPDELRGRVASVSGLFTGSGPQLGQLQTGMLAELAGAPAAALIGSLVTLSLIGALSTLPTIRDFQNPTVRPLGSGASGGLATSV